MRKLSSFLALCAALVLAALLSGCAANKQPQPDSAVSSYDKSGFVVFRDGENRLIVFREGEEALGAYQAKQKLPGKHFTHINACVERMSIKSIQNETIDAYTAARDRSGFSTEMVEGRLWVYVAGSEEETKYKGQRKPGKHFTQINACVDRKTVKAIHNETIDAYLLAR